MQTKTRIRNAEDNEREVMADITRLSYREFAGVREPEYWKQYEEDTRKTILSDPLLARIVAEYDGRIVGSVILCAPYEWRIAEQVVKNPYPEMRLLAVLPEFRNKKIGDDLITACEELIASKGIDHITLHTTQLMKTAMAMYERRGYIRYESIDFSPSPEFTVFGYIKAIQSKS
jgi:ribosomal protein S18 acetylase RimI-like enzyme